MISTLLSLFIFLVYIISAIIVFKEIPKSISNTYYMYEKKNKHLKYLFPIMMFSIVALLLPSWLEITFSFQFLSFLTCASILFVGAAPNFKKSTIENRVHSISAIFAAICSILWSCLVVHTWGLIIINIIYFILMALITKTLKKSYIFWLETTAFISLYESLIIYYIII
jgi:hypothetical protein